MIDTKTLIKYVRDRLNDEPNITFGKPTVRDLVEALEHAEARAEKAEAENARLAKMVDWLANQAADICADAYPKSEVLRWWEDSNWKEAARRAVAAGEETCQK